MRPISPAQQGLLDALLAHDFEGADALRVQAANVAVRQGCTCGCGTIDLIPQGNRLPLSSASSPVPCEGLLVDETGADIGGLILFVRDGLLSSLEVYSYQDPLPLPDLDQVIWQ